MSTGFRSVPTAADRFRGLVIDDEGKVAASFERNASRCHRPIEHEIDGGGRTLLPGLIDAHGHVMALGFTALQLDLTGTKSLADLQQRLKAYAEPSAQGPLDLGPRLEPGTLDDRASRPPPTSTQG